VQPPFLRFKQQLYTACYRYPDELALAAQLLLNGPPSTEQLADFLDFFAIEWVFADGLTLVEKLELPSECLRWPLEVKNALWVVDDFAKNTVFLRDIATEDEVAVEASGLQAELPKKMVLRARVIPWEQRWFFSGEPELVEPLGVLARMDLLRAWQQGPEPELIARLGELRAAFGRLRREREAWVEFFKGDELVFEGPEALQQALDGLAGQLFKEKRVELSLGGILKSPGKHGAIYDAVEGIHFLPCYGEFLEQLSGKASHPNVLALYREDPGITRLPFDRAIARFGAAQVAAALELDKPGLAAWLASKNPKRWALSLLPDGQ
jgi:hypothetical protein